MKNTNSTLSARKRAHLRAHSPALSPKLGLWLLPDTPYTARIILKLFQFPLYVVQLTGWESGGAVFGLNGLSVRVCTVAR
jgi:hypothetical protein